MKPSASHLIEAARLALEEHVAPDVKSELAASAVRSIKMILKHLAVRSECEGAILWEENRALRALMAHCARNLNGMHQPPGTGLSRRLEQALSASRVEASEYPSTELLDEENTTLRFLLDEVLTAVLSALGTHPEGDSLKAIRSAIRTHLDQQLVRERVLYFPVFTGPPV